MRSLRHSKNGWPRPAQHWCRSSGAASKKRTCAVWFSSRKCSRMRRLSLHCGDNWAGVISRSVRTLRQKIGGMFFERSALSKKPDQIIRQELDALQAEDRFTPDLVLQDPYLLDFLGRRIRTARRICSRRCCARSSASCWSAGRASPLSSGRSESRSTATTTTWTCSSITAGCGGWS